MEIIWLYKTAVLWILTGARVPNLGAKFGDLEEAQVSESKLFDNPFHDDEVLPNKFSLLFILKQIDRCGSPLALLPIGWWVGESKSIFGRSLELVDARDLMIYTTNVRTFKIICNSWLLKTV